LAVGLADQSVSSLASVALTIVVARNAGPAGLGAFGVAYALYLIVAGASRAVASEPFLVRLSGAADAEWRAGARDCTGMAVAVGTAAGAVVLPAALVSGGAVGAALLPLAASLPGLLLKDAWRFAFIAAGRPWRAVLNDGVWGLGQVLAVGGVLVADGRPGVGAFVAAWGASATAAAVFGSVQSGCAPAPWRAGRWIAAHRDLLPGYTVDFAARMGGRQLALLATGALGGLPALAAIRAAEILFGALNVVLQAVPLVTVPAAVAAGRRSATALRRAVRGLTAALVALALGYGALVLLVPDELGRALAGESWTLARPVLLAECALFVSIAAITGPALGLRAIGDARGGATIRLMVVPLSVLCGAGGAWTAGAPGALYGLALANCAGLVLWWRQFARALAGPPPSPRSEALMPASRTA
ncbi:MATE family efflux transporter, partial [Actinomadura soli]|uniref:hypothetical protein n=1 Tax=Actinomadura soli TaxID=2508997 RepID=UPI001486AE12